MPCCSGASASNSLPFLFILLGAATLVLTLTYSVAIGRFESRRVSTALLMGAALLLLLGRAAVTLNVLGLYPALWLGISLTAAILGTLVWNVAGDLCDARQAKRLFPLFASAGILGSVVGNLLTGPLAQRVDDREPASDRRWTPAGGRRLGLQPAVAAEFPGGRRRHQLDA